MDSEIFGEVINQAGYDPYAYSGRFMYGEKCIAFNTDDSVFSAIANLIEATLFLEYDDLMYELSDMLRKARTDSMGLGTVIYFPSIKFEEDQDEL